MIDLKISILLLCATALFGLFVWPFMQVVVKVISIRKGRPVLLIKGIPIRRVIRTGDYYKRFPAHFVILLLLNEDERFCSHYGFNFPEIFRALASVGKRKRMRGGSSITQQVAKQLMPLYIFRKKNIVKSFIRKIVEIPSTLLIESLFSKNDILSMYLDVVNFLGGVSGIEGASNVFLLKDCKDLTIAESHVLISMIPSPTRFNQKQAELPLHHWARFDYCLAYEKIIIATRLLQKTSQVIPHDTPSSVIASATTPLMDKSDEENIIRIVTGTIHQIPQILNRIDSVTSKGQLFLDPFLDKEYCLMLLLFLNSTHLNSQLVLASINEMNIDIILQRSRKHEILQLEINQAGPYEDNIRILNNAAKVEQQLISESNNNVVKEFEKIVENITRKFPQVYVGGDYFLVKYCYRNSGERRFQSLTLVAKTADAIFIEEILEASNYHKIDNLGLNFRQGGCVALANHYVNESCDLRITIAQLNDSNRLQDLVRRSRRETTSNGVMFSLISPLDELLHRIDFQLNIHPIRLLEIQDICKIISVGSLDVKDLLHMSDENNNTVNITTAILLAYLLGSLHIPTSTSKNPFSLIIKDRDRFASIFDQILEIDN